MANHYWLYCMLWHNLAIVDVETTGGSPPHDRIIEIGIALIDYGRLTHTYSHLINPQTWISPFITQLTGITPEDLDNQPTFHELASDIFPRLNNRLFVAHNARFDLSFIRSEFTRLNYTFTPKHLCSARLSRHLFPRYRSHSLDSLISRYGLIVTQRHRALGDSLAVWDFFQQLTQTLSSSAIESAISQLSKRPSLPTHLQSQIIDNLSPSPGVYIFYDREHCPLYVGKSINVKDRVLSHFYSDLDSARERSIKEQLTQIEVIPAAGDLDAQLLESKLVKELQPVYNRQLRLTRELVGLRLVENNDHYLTAQLDRLEQIPADFSQLYGLYKSRKQAQTALEQLTTEKKLCFKFMGLEATKRACFGYHLNSCRGACVGKEPPARYNLRLLEALGPRKLLEWPFTGAIAIKETSEVNGRAVTHIFNHWHHLGTFENSSPDSFTPEVGAAFTSGVDMSGLNLDTYKILRRYLQHHPHRVHPLS